MTDALFATGLVQSVECMETTVRGWWESPFGQKNQLKLIIEIPVEQLALVKHKIAALRCSTSEPPYAIPMSHLSTEVTAWVRAVIEIKSATL